MKKTKKTWEIWLVFTPKGHPYVVTNRAEARRMATLMSSLGSKGAYTVRKVKCETIV